MLALGAYGLVDKETWSLTPLGSALLAEPTAEKRSEAFAKHILLNCDGLGVVQAVRFLGRQGTRPTKLKLADALRHTFGYEIPKAPTRQTTILNWLAEAGVCADAHGQYAINEQRVGELIGISPADVEGWHELSPDQRHVALALRFLSQTHGKEAIPAHDVVEFASNKYGLEAPEDQLANRIFAPLEQAGWLKRIGRGSGRGGKSGYLQPVQKLLDPPIDAITDEQAPGIPPDLMRRLQEPLEKIRDQLKSGHTGVKGIALELLALRMVIDLGLTPKGFRVRSSETGGAEVDLTAEGAHLLFSRWTFQCKNTSSVNLSDLAKEIGMATLLKAHVIVMVTTGRFAASVEHFANQIAQTTPLQIVLVSGDFVQRYLESDRRSIGVLMTYFRTTATRTMQLKGPQSTTGDKQAVSGSPEQKSDS